MELQDMPFEGDRPIDGYGPGFFRVGGEVHDAPVAVLPGGVTGWGGLEDAETLLAARDRIDVLFMGMGSEITPAPAELRATLEEAGLGVEIMSSPAACRTYNVLLSEGRRIGAALLPVS